MELKKITIEVTALEAHLIKLLRRYNYAIVKVHKRAGKPERVEVEENILLKEEEGMQL